MEEVFYKKIKVAWSLIYTLPGVPPPIRRSVLDSYVDTPFADEIPLIEMARKFSFPNMRLYPERTPGSHHMQGFQLNSNRLSRNARFHQKKVAILKCNTMTAISAFKRSMLPNGNLYKELTKYMVVVRSWCNADLIGVKGNQQMIGLFRTGVAILEDVGNFIKV
ncbi:hypothetical protein DY000_02013448 [Brassica cretica]|uniref:Uncharacterized protein n=1 Tax=Brassica cretica TaxID=69181 RepID=A0ABQ7CUU1_BRACR|nr:hypothetical protein DY000_02013448 [Brassica cretica]